MGHASENLVQWTLYVRFVPLGRFREVPRNCRVREAKFTRTDTEIMNII